MYTILKKLNIFGSIRWKILVRGEGIAAEFSKKNNVLPFGLSDGLILKNMKKMS